MVRTDDLRPEIRLCPPERHGEALGVLYRRIPALVRAQVIEQALREAKSGALDLSGLWIARRNDRVIGTLLTQLLVGRAAAIWPPEVLLTWNRSPVAAALVDTALAHLKSRGARLAQALLESDAPRQASLDLIRGGLPAITELEYLKRDTRSELVGTPPRGWVWTSFQPDLEFEFRAVLEATYEDSLDMPELDGVRSLDDILASHRATGRFSASHWLLGRIAGEPDASALLLLAPNPVRSSWEVSYLGLSKSARGRGLGRGALAHAVELARPSADWLELAVDLRNTPARRLYAAAGFVRFDRRRIHLKIL